MIRILILGLMLVPSLASAQETKTALDLYRAQSLELRLTGWGGFGGVSDLYRDDKKVKLTFLGGNAEEIFPGSPEALAHMETYKKLRVSGFALWVVGLTALVTNLVILLTDQDLAIDPVTAKPTGLFWGLTVSGTVVGISGGLMINFSERYLSDAVVAYNKSLYNRLRGGDRAQGTRRFVISYTTRF